VRVAWVSHQWPTPDDTPPRPGLMPGRYAGGAEFLQDMMRTRAPEGVETVAFHSRESLDGVEDCDRVVVGATELLSDESVARLAALNPLVWLMSPQSAPAFPLIAAARPVVWASELLRHLSGIRFAEGGRPFGEICPGWWDTTVVPRGVPKEPFALWAGRDVWHKGEGESRRWAEERGIPFVAMKNRPRAEVLEAMSRAEWFVTMAQGIVDPCPTTVIEAEIAGCKIAVSDLVGRTPVRGAEENAAYIEGCAERFWGWVCD
jgi:hypothetical protein